MDNTFIDPEDLYENPYPPKKRKLPPSQDFGWKPGKFHTGPEDPDDDDFSNTPFVQVD